MMAMYQVTAPLVIAKSPVGADLHLYRGALIEGQSDTWVEDHLDMGFIEPFNQVGDTVDVAGEMPKPQSSIEVWRRYAVSQGMDADEADTKSKSELRILLEG